MATWDVIVLGLGGVGSAAAMHLATAGHRVLGLDRYGPVHVHGSSHGRTRVIRQAYFEHPSYVPMLRRAYQLWDDLERQSGEHLFHRTGLIEIGPPDGVVMGGVRRSAREHHLAIEEMTWSEVASTWPGLRGESDWHAIVERDAGFLRVEECVAAHLQLAQQAGAVCRHHQTARRWEPSGTGVQVTTDDGTESAAHLVIAAGPWANRVASGIGADLQVVKKQQYWLATDDDGYGLNDGFPCFFYETPSGYFYGFPAMGNEGLKVARHSGGQPVDGPQESDEEDIADRQRVTEFMKRFLPGVSDRLISRAGCYYTVTPDEHFVIDHLPDRSQVTVIAGLSGHGFKFTSVLGEIACQMATGQTQSLDTSFFRATRFG